MKVISGLLKGRNIEGFDIEGTRPTMDRVKESIFSTIQFEIRDAVVLSLLIKDIYSLLDLIELCNSLNLIIS